MAARGSKFCEAKGHECRPIRGDGKRSRRRMSRVAPNAGAAPEVAALPHDCSGGPVAQLVRAADSSPLSQALHGGRRGGERRGARRLVPSPHGRSRRQALRESQANARRKVRDGVILGFPRSPWVACGRHGLQLRVRPPHRRTELRHRANVSRSIDGRPSAVTLAVRASGLSSSLLLCMPAHASFPPTAAACLPGPPMAHRRTSALLAWHGRATLKHSGSSAAWATSIRSTRSNRPLSRAEPHLSPGTVIWSERGCGGWPCGAGSRTVFS